MSTSIKDVLNSFEFLSEDTDKSNNFRPIMLAYKRIRIRFIAAVFVFLVIFPGNLLTARGETESESNNNSLHVIRINEDGVVIGLKDNKDRQVFKKYVNTMLDRAEALGEKKAYKKDGKTIVKILIHVHGGLVKFKDTEERIRTVAKQIMNDESDWYYPVFISWPSDLGSSYTEQLLKIRQGVKKKWPVNIIGIPFIFISQVGTSIGKIPENWYYQLVNSKDNIANSFGKYNWVSHMWKEADKNSGYSFSKDEFTNECSVIDLCNTIKQDVGDTIAAGKPSEPIENLKEYLRVPKLYERLYERHNGRIVYSKRVELFLEKTRNYRSKEFSKLNRKRQYKIQRLNRLLIEETYPESPKSFDIYRSEFLVSKKEYLKRYIYRTATFPSRATIGGLAHSTFGEASWKNMKRRTSNIFYPVHFFDNRYENGIAGGDFFGLLFERITSEKKNAYKYEITLVGHSMGTIILNKVLSKFQREWRNTKSLKNIVYMAAACSINEAKDTVVPLILSMKESSQGESEIPHFYNLTLNRAAEIDECVGYYTAPSGSLLEYIDDHYEKPEMQLDRTLGKEVNVLASAQVFDGVKPYVHFKSFDRYTGYIPAGHGDFNKCQFWKNSFWSTDTMTEKTPFVLNCYAVK